MQISSTSYLPTPLPTSSRSATQGTTGDDFATMLVDAGQRDAKVGTTTVQTSASDLHARQVLAQLTDGDRALVIAAFGTTLTANGSDAQGRALAPMSVWMLAADRGSGRLPAGQPVTAQYLTQQRNLYASGSAVSADMVQQYDKLLAALGSNGGRAPVDVLA